MRNLLNLLLTITIFLTGCDVRKKVEVTGDGLPLQGTWELLSETKIEQNDTIFTPAADDQRMIKIINESHFSFLRHDLKQGKDTTNAQFVAGGGSYTLKGNEYTERLEFCNFREWENHTFTFNVEIRNDTLIQHGREKIEGLDIDRIIIEKYKRVTK